MPTLILHLHKVQNIELDSRSYLGTWRAKKVSSKPVIGVGPYIVKSFQWSHELKQWQLTEMRSTAHLQKSEKWVFKQW